tara:strand:+ start:3429 stop:3800 length:372 start_codon:yes stop_codon:yes gene_type:complete
MSERKQRTPAEIIAETEAKLSRLVLKQAKQEAMSNPAITPLVAELDALRIDIREAKKGLGDGPQSFNARVVKHEIWIDKIEIERLDAEATLSSASQRKAEIELEIASAVTQVVEAPKEFTAGA